MLAILFSTPHYDHYCGSWYIIILKVKLKVLKQEMNDGITA